MNYDIKEPIAALATPWGESAIAVIRTSGDDCIELMSHLCDNPGLGSAKGHSMVYGNLIDPAADTASGAKIVDEVMFAVFRGRRSYTGEDSVEIYCHGSLPGISRILTLLKDNGFRDAQPGEFTMRAFVNGKLDLTKAEAVHEVISSKTMRAQELAMERLGGAIEKIINSSKADLALLVSAVELQLDYPEEDLPDIEIPKQKVQKVIAELSKLSATYKTGKIFQDGVTIALAGATNAGKSTLFNFLVKEDRAIVSGIHGTTRDYIESWLTIEGIPVRLYDTAGIREIDEEIESEGIRRSLDIVKNAALVLYVVDGNEGIPADTDALPRGIDGKTLFLWNKSDSHSNKAPEGYIPISAQTGDGLGDLHKKIIERIVTIPQSGAVVIDSLRQKELLDRCIEALQHVLSGLDADDPLDVISLDVNEALECLGEITGEVTKEDIYDTMFSSFCVGK